MITVHYTVDPSTYGCTAALNDMQAVHIFDSLIGKTDGSVKLVNELAFETLRTLIAEDKIDHKHVLVLLTFDNKTTVHTFNTFGNLLKEDGKGPHHFETPADRMMYRRGHAIAAKQRIARLQRDEAKALWLANKKVPTIPEPLASAIQAMTKERDSFHGMRIVGEPPQVFEHRKHTELEPLRFRTRAEQQERRAETVKEQ